MQTKCRKKVGGEKVNHQQVLEVQMSAQATVENVNISIYIGRSSTFTDPGTYHRYGDLYCI